jgi:hypothetical protein
MWRREGLLRERPIMEGRPLGFSVSLAAVTFLPVFGNARCTAASEGRLGPQASTRPTAFPEPPDFVEAT